jgi:hypothetical protein
MIAWLVFLASITGAAQRSPPPLNARRAWALDRFSRRVDVP